MEEKREKTGFSFGFTKKAETKVLKRTEDDLKEETDYIASLEGKKLKSVKPKEEKKELVIPLIKTNNWKTKHENKNKDVSSLDSQAVDELMQDAAKQKDDWDSRGIETDSLEVPLLMQNKVPEGYEEDDRLDVSLRPDEPEDTDYDSIPIESFGMAMLKGMGWKPGQGIGKNNKSVAPVEAVLRPKGMGLGADRKQAQTLNNSKQGSGNGQEEKREELTMKKGAYCMIVKGPYKDLYAMIEGMDEDNARLMVKLTVSGKSITVSQYNTHIVSKDEYSKYSKYLNKGATDRYKEKEDRKKEKNGEHGDSDEKRRGEHEVEERLSGRVGSEGSDMSHDKSDRRQDKYRGDSERSDRKKDKYREDRDRSDGKSGKYREEKERSDRKRDKYGSVEDGASSKRQRLDEDRYTSTSSKSATNGTSHPASRLWVKPKLRVRIVSEKYKKGKYYNAKVTILDVLDEAHCVCETDEGRVLEDVAQSMLETVVPRSDSSYVSIVTGKYRGQIAHVLEKNKRSGEATLQLLSDRDRVVILDFDSICEYVGDVNEEFDF